MNEEIVLNANTIEGAWVAIKLLIPRRRRVKERIKRRITEFV